MQMGVTGAFLSGKSTCAQMIASSLHWDVFSCDAYVDGLYSHEIVRNNIVDNFGKALYKGSTLQKNKLAKLVFSDAATLKQLESIIHPWVETEIQRLIQKESQNTVFEIPLLYETDLHKLMDICVWVQCPLELRKERAELRGFSAHEVEKRQQFQLSDPEREKYHPHIIKNTGTLDDLATLVTAWVRQLKQTGIMN